MKIEDIEIGCEYQVDAPNTSSREIWTVRSIDGGGITCIGNKTAFARTFLPHQIIKIHSHMEKLRKEEERKEKKAQRQKDKEMKTEEKEIQSEIVKVVGSVRGHDMCVENIIYMPFHERRGRKSNGRS